MPRARVWIAAALMLFVAVAWQYLTFNGFPNDSYVHIARARQLLLGAWPVRDFVDPGLPLMYGISAAGRWLIGDVALSELAIVALGIGVGAAATLLAASTLARSVIVACLVTLLQILASPRSYSYPKLLLYGLGGCAIVSLADRADRNRVLLAAALIAVAFLVRHDHAMYLGLACAVTIVAGAPGLKDAASRLVLFGAVVIGLLAPWAAYVEYYQGLTPYFQSAILFSRREADISLMRDWPRLQTTAGFTASNAEAWLFYLFYALPIACLVLIVWRRLSRTEQWPGECAAVGALSVLALTINTGFLRTPLSTRLPDATVPASLLGAWLLGLAWSRSSGGSVGVVGRRAAAVVLLAATSLAVWKVGDVHDKLDEAGAFDDWDHVREHASGLFAVMTQPEMNARKMPSRVSAGLVPFFHYLDRCTAPTDRLLVTGPYPDVFVLGRRGFAAGHIAFMQGFYNSEADQALMLTRMQHESVPFVLLVQDEQAAFEGNFPTLLAYINRAYDPMADVPVDGMKGVRVFVERTRHALSVDTVTGWPCFKTRTGAHSVS